MKHLLFLILIFTSFQSYSQQDTLWLIKDSRYHANTNSKWSASNNSINSCNIINVSHPQRFSGYPYPEAPRNDLFIIYNDGTFFNSRYLNGQEWSDYGGVGKNNYSLRINNSSNPLRRISHLYWTNVYEDDDIPPSIIAPGPPTFYPFSRLSNPLIGNSPPISAITANHSPSIGKDVTLIIDHSKLVDSCTYNLCYTISANRKDTTKVPSSMYSLEISRVFGSTSSFLNQSYVASGGGTSANLTHSNPPMVDSCVTNLVFPTTSGFTYVNLFVPRDTEDTVTDNMIRFSLSSPGCARSEFMQDTIRDSHDPNYIEVLCVERPAENNISTIKYRAQCMNDGAAPQDTPSIEFTFPFTIDIADIIITDASIKDFDSNTTFNTYAPIVTFPSQNRVKFLFEGELKECPPPQELDVCKAWVEFCVKVHSDSVNVLTGNIQPYLRNTNFGDRPYKIEKFIDLPCINGEEPNNLNSPNNPNSSNIDEIIYCERPNSSCVCTEIHKPCPWYSFYCRNTINWVNIGFLGILLILIIVLSTWRKSPG